MTKPEFFKLCDGADQTLAHQLEVIERREYRGLDNIIEITGSTWCRGGLTGREVYRPLPGRQGAQDAPYAVANARMAAKLPIFKKWLNEWKLLRGIKEPDGNAKTAADPR